MAEFSIMGELSL